MDQLLVSQFILPLDSLPPGGQANHGYLAPRGASCPGISYPRPGYLRPRGASCPGRFILPPAHTEKILLCDVYYYLQHFNNYMQFLSYKYVNLRWLLQIFSWVSYWQGVGGGGQAVQGGLSCPPPRISKKLDNQQFLLHQLLQKYLVERDINFISVNLRCLHQMFSWVTYWQGVGSKLTRAVYLAPSPELQREWIIHKFLLHHLLQEYLVERDINFISVNLRCLLQTFSWVTYWQGVGGKLSRAVYLAPRPEFQREWIIHKFYYTIYYRNI